MPEVATHTSADPRRAHALPVPVPDTAGWTAGPRTESRKFQILLEITHAVAAAASLECVLPTIAARAAELAGADYSVILLLDNRDRLSFGAGYGLPGDYRTVFDRGEDYDRMVCVISLRRRQTVVIEDTESHPLWEPWKHLGRKGGFRAMVASPLMVGRQPVGVLMVYRREAGPWPAEAEAWLKLTCAHIASAVRLGQLLDERRRRLAALARAAEGLNDQTLEHVKSLETMAAMLEPGTQHGADRLMAHLQREHHTTTSAIEGTIQHRILAGLLLAELSIAQQRGIRLELDPRSQIACLPAHLTEADAVSVVSNLLDNAFDAVQDADPARRRVRLLVRRRQRDTVIRVRDWGVGLNGLRRSDLVTHGYSTKLDHSGAGLALVADIVAAADGRLEVQARDQGAEFRVAVPNE